MINQHTFTFLKWLSEFNDKRFFDLNKELYKKIQSDFLEFWTKIIKWISEFDQSIYWTEAKKCTFRINRDARFSKNKDPYKTNLGIFIAPWGKKSILPWYYIHIEPWKSFFWWWIFYPTTENAYKIRYYIYEHFREFESILQNKEFKKYFKDVYTFQEPLKKAPKWTEESHTWMKYIKYKDWLAKDINFTDEQVLAPNFENNVLEYCQSLYLLNNFLHKALVN